MTQNQQSHSNEAETALCFYKEIVQALKASGIRRVLITMRFDGELKADVIAGKSPRCGGDRKKRNQHDRE